MSDSQADMKTLNEALTALGENELTNFRRLDFKPLAILNRLQEIQAKNGGQSAVVLIDRELHAEFIWNYENRNLERLVTLKRRGAWIAGFMAFPSDSRALTFPETGKDAPLFQSLLSIWADLYQKDQNSQKTRELDELLITSWRQMRGKKVDDCLGIIDACLDAIQETTKDSDPLAF